MRKLKFETVNGRQCHLQLGGFEITNTRTAIYQDEFTLTFQGKEISRFDKKYEARDFVEAIIEDIQRLKFEGKLPV